MNKRLLVAAFTVAVILFTTNLFAANDYMAHRPLSPDIKDGAAPVTTEYRVDLDGDKTNEIVKIRYGGIIEKTFDGHIVRHRYVVAIYKLIKGNEVRQDQYTLWDIYTTQ